VSLDDLEYMDSDIWMLETNITDIRDKTFSLTEKRFGNLVAVELKPRGKDVPVTEDNKKEYVDAVVIYHISTRIKKQFDARMEGLLELIPRDLIDIFDERELELLISGASGIDMDDWIKFTAIQILTEPLNGSGSVSVLGP